jgi:hypothetical protein
MKKISFTLLIFLSILTACADTLVIVSEREAPQKDDGEECIVNSECESGRCVDGVCVDTGCQLDDDCLIHMGEICVMGECVPADDFACQGDQAPLINVTPLAVSFGEVALGNELEEIVTIENLGFCLLTLQGVGLADDGQDSSRAFSCEPCDVSSYPTRIPPERSLDVLVRYSPTEAGEAQTQLLIRSDDDSAGEDGLIAVDLFASYSGQPVLNIEPSELNFGYVPFVAGASEGNSQIETIRIKNAGSGNAVLHVERILLDNGSNFSLVENEALMVDGQPISESNPLMLSPEQFIDVSVQFSPTENREYNDELVVRAHNGDPAGTIRATANLAGSALGPPLISVQPLELEFKDDNGDPIAVGMVGFKQVTISNQGQSALDVTLALSDSAGVYSISPPILPPVAAGGTVLVSVFFNPLEPSDPANQTDPQTSTDGFLNITSTDETNVLTTVPLRGWAKGGDFNDVLKLEMNFERGDSDMWGTDLREVDLELRGMVGSCKVNRNYTADGVIDASQDPCTTWNNYGVEGHVQHFNGDRQETVTLDFLNMDDDTANGTVFIGRIHYHEDCKNLPSGIMGDLLGIGTSILGGVIGASVGVPIGIDPSTVSDLITENCWSFGSSLTTVKVLVNNQEIGAPQFRLNDKGDYHDIVRIQRLNGQFVLE